MISEFDVTGYAIAPGLAGEEVYGIAGNALAACVTNGLAVVETFTGDVGPEI